VKTSRLYDPTTSRTNPTLDKVMPPSTVRQSLQRWTLALKLTAVILTWAVVGLTLGTAPTLVNSGLAPLVWAFDVPVVLVLLSAVLGVELVFDEQSLLYSVYSTIVLPVAAILMVALTCLAVWLVHRVWVKPTTPARADAGKQETAREEPAAAALLSGLVNNKDFWAEVYWLCALAAMMVLLQRAGHIWIGSYPSYPDHGEDLDR